MELSFNLEEITTHQVKQTLKYAKLVSVSIALILIALSAYISATSLISYRAINADLEKSLVQGGKDALSNFKALPKNRRRRYSVITENNIFGQLTTTSYTPRRPTRTVSRKSNNLELIGT